MALKDTKKTAKGTAGKTATRPKNPFGSPHEDESFEITIPEGAESGKIPASDQYIGKVIGLERETSQSGNPMFIFSVTIVQGPYTGMDFRLWAPLIPTAMWKLADILTALGIDFTVGKPLTVRKADVLGTLVRMDIQDDKYNGRDVSKLKALLPHPDGAGKKGKAGAVVSDEDEDEDEPPVRRGRAPVVEDDEDEDEAPAPRRRTTASSLAHQDDEEDEPEQDDEQEDEDEDEAEVRRVVAKQRANKVPPRAVDEDEEEEEEEPTPRRRPRAVVVEDEDDEEEPAPRRPIKTTVKSAADVRRNPAAAARAGRR